MILCNAVLWYYTFGQFHSNVTLVTTFLIYIFENNKSYVQNEAHFRRVWWELNYFPKKCNILTLFLLDFYVTNIRLLWKCPSRLRHSFITTLFFRSVWWRYNQVLLYKKVLPGVMKRSLMTLAHSYPSTVQSSAQYLTPWLMWTIALFIVLLDVTPMRIPGLFCGGGGSWLKDKYRFDAILTCKHRSLIFHLLISATTHSLLHVNKCFYFYRIWVRDITYEVV
jgi:hypothetical protein